MRHGKKVKKLGRVTSHRKAMLANMASSLLIHKRIKTTEAKAKEARRLVERLITYGKKDSTHSRRLAFSILRNKEVVRSLFEEIAPVYAERNGGYTRIYKLGRRPNDAAKVVLLELVDFLGSESPAKKDKSKKSKPKGKAVEEKAVAAEVEEKTESHEKAEDAGEGKKESVTAEESVKEKTVDAAEPDAAEKEAVAEDKAAEDEPAEEDEEKKE